MVRNPERLMKTAIIAATLLVMTATGAEARSRNGIGFLAGLQGTEHFFLGAQAEMGPVAGTANLVPSLHLALGDEANHMFNLDLRWYLLRLPETGIHVYGSVGPAIVFANEANVGLNLTAGFNIPMKNRRRYNAEFRFGFGDAPDLKFAAAIMFGL